MTRRNSRSGRTPEPTSPPGGRGAWSNPLVARYATAEMAAIFSDQNRYSTWRRIWVALAEAQRELGLPIRASQIRALRRHIDTIDFEAVRQHERLTRHDVMAHILAYGDQVPQARGILHLGATSMDVVDNADLVLMRDALRLLTGRLAAVCAALADFCETHADLPALGMTHLQPAQLTTVGKRASLWLADLLEDLRRVDALWRSLRCRGLRGASGTQASFLRLLGSGAKVRQLERRFARRLGFDACYPVTGQTYSRRVDAEMLAALAVFAADATRACNDVRILCMLRELDEPFGAKQVGSSAMPWKRNPILCERATGLARFVMHVAGVGPATHAAQMLERTLDDSSAKRLSVPQAFLAADAICAILHGVFSGLVVYPASIEARVRAELPFIAAEDILMQAVARGGDRQALHERIRRHALAAAERVKRCGEPADLLERLRADPAFAGLDFSRLLDPRRHAGLAAQQVRALLRREVRPTLAKLEKNGLFAPPAAPQV